MIAPQELRLGNWININGNPFQIEMPDFNLIVNKNGKSTYEPIELNEDWLLKFGFDSNNVAYKIDNDRFVFELYFYDAWNLNYVEKEKFGNGSVELSGYWKIHELQNLFFTLTGEELKIKK
ncbi:hypothetical protein KBP46_10025 [Chryseobacterium sp. PCH239]|uniref:hypothetical protein n=1 Tax=Chryseobacterium sp. PCH239 TaxID=2825845 RepID=UPI001C10D561|nr:hypothetical protein [Chryseobacterium sp. PCH239]QWT88133.1 hypothetical protein KBP46_10025 [Chryseobacterium sp. PCH239]